jgi:DNA-binding winged helix-turn-helix (wHTH) protein
MSSTTLYFDAFSLELTTDQLWRGPERLKLTAKAFAVLRYLALHPERVVSKAELFEAVWLGRAVSDWALTACVREVRCVLGEVAQRPRIIETVHGRGYRFLPAMTTQPGPRATGQGPDADLPHAASCPQLAVFVGRETELGRLHALLDLALQGARQCVFVTGEPGIGKPPWWKRFSPVSHQGSRATGGPAHGSAAANVWSCTSPVRLICRCWKRWDGMAAHRPVPRSKVFCTPTP